MKQFFTNPNSVFLKTIKRINHYRSNLIAMMLLLLLLYLSYQKKHDHVPDKSLTNIDWLL